MKPSVVLIAALAGLGGWLYMQLSPYPADQRLQEFKKLPGVESVVEWSEMRIIERQFNDAENGSVSFSRDGVTSTWNSVAEWKADFEAFDRNARYWYNMQQNAERSAAAKEKAQAEADGGSLDALRSLAMMGGGQTKNGSSIAGMLRNHGSATAQMTLQQYVQGSMDFSSREGMLLNAKSMQENYRWEDMTDDMFAQATQQNQRGLSNLQRQADAGDPDAKWVMGQLHGDTPVRIRVPN